MPKTLPADRALTKTEAAYRAKVHVRTLCRWVAAGKLTKYTKGANRMIVDRRELDKLVADRDKITVSSQT